MDYYERFSDDLKLRGYAKRSRQSYLRAVRQFQHYCCKSLPEITEEDLRKYWLCCKEDFKWSPATIRISYSGIKHFFAYTIKRDWSLFGEFKLERSESLPVVLSIDEVRTILSAFPEGQNRTYFETVYSLGLRLTEAITLQVRDIDSARMLVHVHAGKGAKDRLVPLPESTLHALRRYWKTHRNKKWIFPGLGRDSKGGATAKTPVSAATVQGALRRVCSKLGFRKHVRTHTFRHSYATHLIEAGVPVRHVQDYLGHDTLTSTMIYLHLTTAGKEKSRSRIDQLMRGVLS
jgi:site-specific recombinase XerD